MANTSENAPYTLQDGTVVTKILVPSSKPLCVPLDKQGVVEISKFSTPDESIHLGSDSITVLWWIRGQRREFKPFLNKGFCKM